MNLNWARSLFWNCLPSGVLRREFSFQLPNGKRRSHIELGDLGEKMARQHLRRMGRKILYSNYRGPKGGELDIVARDGEVLTFIEVKTRKKRAESRPLDAVTLEKQHLIERGARAWLGLLPDNEFLWRFDVVEVILDEGEIPQICVINHAF